MMMLLFQISSPRFPVVVKMGHAHSGMGKVRGAQVDATESHCHHSVVAAFVILFFFFCLCFSRLRLTINMIFKILPALWPSRRPTPHLSPSSTQSMMCASRRLATITKPTCE